MTRRYQEPTTTAERDGTVHTHPAFGQISLTRVSGDRTLYGSDFQHNTYIALRIRASDLRRDLARDWHFARQEHIEVHMSEAQWATFVSSFSIGEGVPCTINHLNGKSVPEFPLRDSGQEFKREADDKLSKVVKELEQTLTFVRENTVGLSGTKVAKITARLETAIRETALNVPFIAQQFSEHIEERVEKAKVEVAAYTTATITRVGLDLIEKRRNRRDILELARDDVDKSEGQGQGQGQDVGDDDIATRVVS
jgi:hypothetical protein